MSLAPDEGERQPGIAKASVLFNLSQAIGGISFFAFEIFRSEGWGAIGLAGLLPYALGAIALVVCSPFIYGLWPYLWALSGAFHVAIAIILASWVQSLFGEPSVHQGIPLVLAALVACNLGLAVAILSSRRAEAASRKSGERARK